MQSPQAVHHSRPFSTLGFAAQQHHPIPAAFGLAFQDPSSLGVRAVIDDEARYLRRRNAVQQCRNPVFMIVIGNQESRAMAISLERVCPSLRGQPSRLAIPSIF
jgi:hypothetical protein